MRILFWDIDGTLIRTSKAGLYALAQATEEIWGKSVDMDKIQAAGMTDNYIARQIIESLLGREATLEEIAMLCRRYETILPAQLAARDGLILPEVINILSQLYEREEYKLLLLTGNSVHGAQIKLRHFELAKYFDFSCSAFAAQYERRVDIARSALEIVRSNWGNPEQHEIFVIGDTPHDVECGKAIGAYTIGTATGRYTVDQLELCAPWWVVDSLPSHDIFIEKIAAGKC